MNRAVISICSALFALSTLSGCSLRRSQPHQCTCSPITLKDLKPMLGSWHGKSSDGEKIEVVTRETSGGTAIEETISPGTGHEMVSVYTADGENGAQMTHYCMLGNQPTLKAKRLSSNEILFEFAGGTNLTPGKGMYMSEMKLTLVGDGHIREDWTAVKDGAPEKTVSFDLWREKRGGCGSSGCKTKTSGCKSKDGCTHEKSGRSAPKKK